MYKEERAKLCKFYCLFFLASTRIVVIKYPLITKNKSMPTHPPLKSSNPAWKRITGQQLVFASHLYQRNISS